MLEQNTTVKNNLGEFPNSNQSDKGRPAIHNPWHKKEFVRLAHFDKQAITKKDGLTIALDSTDIDANRSRLEKALAGRTLGKRLPYHFLNIDLKRKWSRWGDFQLILLTEDCFMCIFSSIEAGDAMLMNGTWFLAGNIVRLDKWSTIFNPDSLDAMTSPIWIRLPQLPLLYWDNNSLARVASFIGEPLWLDHQTNSWGQSMYARVCIRINLAEKLPAGAWINGLTIKPAIAKYGSDWIECWLTPRPLFYWVILKSPALLSGCRIIALYFLT